MNRHYENATAPSAHNNKGLLRSARNDGGATFHVYEDDEPRAPYEPEIAFYSTVAAGDVEKTRMLLAEPLFAKQGLGKLSAHVVTNLKYHTIITISMIARRCIEAGLDLRTSYGLSDISIRYATQCTAFTYSSWTLATVQRRLTKCTMQLQ